MDDRSQIFARWSWAAVITTALACEAGAQPPSPPAGPVAAADPPATATAPATEAPQPQVCTKRGRLHRMFHHTAHTLQDDFIGYPPAFVEPPLGYYLNRQLAVQVSKADMHRFTVYQTDFLPDTDRFSPTGASRFNLMYGRLPAWQGPIFVEWTPDQPELAEARRKAILATLATAGAPIAPERVVIGPPTYPGAFGTEAAGHFNNTITRSESASINFPLTPNESARMGVR